MTHPEIHRATANDATKTAELIADTFFAVDATAWLVPEERARILPAYLEIHIDHALTHGQIHLIKHANGELAAAAIWFAQPTGPMPEPDNYEEQLTAACRAYVDGFRTLDHLLRTITHASTRTTISPAWRRARTSRGADGDPRCYVTTTAKLDHCGTPAFLQATSQQVRKLYERHGYEGLGDPFSLPDGPPFWSMWRGAEGRSGVAGVHRRDLIAGNDYS